MVDPIMLVGALGITLNSISFFALPNMMRSAIENIVNLDPNGPIYKQFLNPPISSIGDYYVYEVKNPREVLKGKRPILSLKGPFRSRGEIKRSNVMLAESNEVLKYDTRRLVQLVEEGSADLDEKFWYLNPIVPSIRESVKSMVVDRVPFKRLTEPIVFNGVNVALDNFNERLLVKRSARDLLMGVKVKMLETVVNAADAVGLKSLVPPGPPENMFGLLHALNYTVDSLEVYTGVGPTPMRSRFADVRRWKDSDRVKAWQGKCSEIFGTNGELFRPNIRPGQQLGVFFPPLCRSFNLEPVGLELKQIQDGLTALEYTIPDKLFRGIKNESRNECFCSNTKAYDCYYDGLIRMSPCFFDAPIFLMRPNFRGLNRKIRSLVDESQLNDSLLPEKQSLYLDPITGAILKVDVALVGSFKLVRQPYMRDLSQVQNLTYMPLFATVERVELPFSLTWQVYIVQKLMGNHKYINFALVLILSASLVFRMRRKRSRRVGARSDGDRHHQQPKQQQQQQRQTQQHQQELNSMEQDASRRRSVNLRDDGASHRIAS